MRHDALCDQLPRATVWDGAQVLVEIRAPGGTEVPESTWESDNPHTSLNTGYHFGRVSYTLALGIDAPLGVTRTGLTANPAITVYPHANWRGEFADGSVPGSAAPCSQGGVGCPAISWPGLAITVDGDRATGAPGPVSWWGSLLNRQTDGSGLQYRRNRYYDPASGTFTQVDPIGLAGGVNLWGYAGGDPVSYSDPFGLCPNCGEGDNGVRARDGFWNRHRHGLFTACSVGSNADCSPTPLMGVVPSFIGGPGGGLSALGRLTSIGAGTWRSTAGLIYGQGSKHGNRRPRHSGPGEGDPRGILCFAKPDPGTG